MFRKNFTFSAFIVSTLIGVWVLNSAGCAQTSSAIAPTKSNDFSRDMTLYLPFDEQMEPRHALGSRIVEARDISFAEGKSGQAIHASSHPVNISGAGNFPRPRGTLAFWTRPAWTPDDAAYKGDRHLFDAVNFTLSYHRARNVFFFMTGKTKDGPGYVWDYNNADYNQVSKWKSGEWHHIAITWDSATGNKAMYLDGKLTSQNTTEWIRDDPFRDAGFVALNANRYAPGAYDELMMWSRVLTSQEIEHIYAQPIQVAQQLNKDLPQTQSVQTWPIEFSLYHISDNQAEKTIVAPGENFIAKIPVKNAASQAWSGEATFHLLDFWERRRATQKQTITIEAGANRVLDVPFIAPEKGIFKIAVQISQSGKTLERDLASFGAWPKPVSAPRADSFFGHHVHSWSEGMTAQAARLGLAWNRGHNMLQHTWWPRVQPEPDTWNWNYGAHRERMQRHKMHVLGQLFGTPYWAAAGGALPRQEGDAAYPYGARPNLEAFRKYVFETVKAFPEIRYWEVWNEPEVSMFWNGSPEEFAKLCRVGYEAIKAANPKAVVMNAGYTQSAWKWHEETAKFGALRHADALSFHAYYPPDAQPEQLWEQFQTNTTHFRNLARKYTRRELPLWDTEGGSGDTTWLRGYDDPKLPPQNLRTPLNWRQAAITAVQSAAMLQSLGIEKSFQYFWHPSSPGNYEDVTALDMTNAPKPKLMARVAMQSQLDGTKYAGQVRRREARLWASVYRVTGNKSVALCWTGTGGRAEVSLPSVSKIVNIMGNSGTKTRRVTVSEEPSYIHLDLPPNRVLALLRSAKISVLKQPVETPGKNIAVEGSGVPQLPDFVAARENPGNVFTVDLRGVANMGFTDEKAGDGIGGWADEGPLNDLRTMPVGRQTFYGVPFEITDPKSNGGRAIITLQGKNVTKTLPSQATIKLPEGKVRVLYFLHAAAWGSPGNIGKYVMRYADGQTAEATIEIPRNSNNWWTGYNTDEESRPVPIRVTNTNDGKPAWRYVRVWEWTNPRREVPLTGIDFVSNGGDQTPILLAITGVR
jgi:hypothetical protein